MRSPAFLSVRPLSWVLSLGIHAAFILGVLWLARPRLLDLTMVTLESAQAKATAFFQPAKEDLWQRPMLKITGRIPLPKPKPEPTPPPPSAQAVPSSGEGIGQIRTVAQVSQLPQFKNQVQAVYPEAAKNANLEGVVMLQVDIDASGFVMDVKVIQSLGSGCDEAAVNAMKQSTFSPAMAGTEAVPVRIRIPYRFKING